MMPTHSESPSLKPFAEGVFRCSSEPFGEPTLLGGWCGECRQYTFPRPSFCPRCFGSLEEVPLGSRGVLRVFTVVRVKAPLGLPQPYAVGYVALDQTPLLIFSLLDPRHLDVLKHGIALKLEVGPMGCDVDGNAQLRPYFTPILFEKE